jgi:ribosomal protein S18 acetylase RimI-like enzyme
MLSIQNAKDADRESLNKCFLSVFDVSEYTHLNMIEDLSYSYVGLDRRGEVKAFAIVIPSNKYAAFEIAYLGISTRYQRKGYAKFLINLVLQNVHSNIWLNTLDSNVSACALYESMGFVLFHTIKYDDITNSLVYVYYKHDMPYLN